MRKEEREGEIRQKYQEKTKKVDSILYTIQERKMRKDKNKLRKETRKKMSQEERIHGKK